ncbi:hypothetical protein DFH09DRAFT_1441724 [Mycena vulgaris]|nr:hypothetical protein DFH09DRAFT_1441724 [Mycena vulgaris]
MLAATTSPTDHPSSALAPLINSPLTWHLPRALNGGGHRPPRPRCLYRSTLRPSTPPSAPRANYHPVAIVPRSTRATTAARRGHSDPDAAVLIGLAIGLHKPFPAVRSPTRTSGYTAQIARRHPRATHRLLRTSRPTDRVLVPVRCPRCSITMRPDQAVARIAQYIAPPTPSPRRAVSREGRMRKERGKPGKAGNWGIPHRR